MVVLYQNNYMRYMTTTHRAGVHAIPKKGVHPKGQGGPYVVVDEYETLDKVVERNVTPMGLYEAEVRSVIGDGGGAMHPVTFSVTLDKIKAVRAAHDYTRKTPEARLQELHLGVYVPHTLIPYTSDPAVKQALENDGFKVTKLSRERIKYKGEALED